MGPLPNPFLLRTDCGYWWAHPLAPGPVDFGGVSGAQSCWGVHSVPTRPFVGGGAGRGKGRDTGLLTGEKDCAQGLLLNFGMKF